MYVQLPIFQQEEDRTAAVHIPQSLQRGLVDRLAGDTATGRMARTAVTGALAFGLGGRELAASMLRDAYDSSHDGRRDRAATRYDPHRVEHERPQAS